MRSPKSRSRSKQNRNNNRSVGNVLNRVFDSSGPEGKVRGTPQQIIDKYNQLARDAQLSNDRVATENFQQHAEHYLRLLASALKEQEARREQQDKENRGRNADRERNRAENGSDISAGNVSDLEKASNASSNSNIGKDHIEATQENSQSYSQSYKDSSGSDDNERPFKANRQKRNNTIQSDGIDNDENKSSNNSSKEAAE